MPANSLTTQQVQARATMCYREHKCFITLQPLEGPQVAYMYHPDARTNVLVHSRFALKEKGEK